MLVGAGVIWSLLPPSEAPRFPSIERGRPSWADGERGSCQCVWSSLKDMEQGRCCCVPDLVSLPPFPFLLPMRFSRACHNSGPGLPQHPPGRQGTQPQVSLESPSPRCQRPLTVGTECFLISIPKPPGNKDSTPPKHTWKTMTNARRAARTAQKSLEMSYLCSDHGGSR